MLPKGYGYDFGGLTREESQTGSNTAIIFGICIILIYLILSALYESFLIPFAVILAVPCGLLGSFILVKLIGQENNILPPDGSYHDYRSVVENRDSDYGVCGRPPQVGHESLASRLLGRQSPSASYSDDRADLRVRYDPAGNRNGCRRNGNSTLGSGRVGGMIVGTLALLFLVPSLFIVFQHLQEKVKPIQFTNTPDWMIEAEIEDSKKENEEKK